MPHSPMPTRDSLREVRYDIRGELSRRARELEGQGRQLIRLNIGNPGAFGFRAPAHLQQAVSAHVGESDPYTHQQGLPLAREAIAGFHRGRGTPNASAERVFVGNGVSELIDISLRALLNPGEEVLLPSPDYPLWSAATILNQGRPVYYRCAPENGFLPDPDEIEKLVTPRTRALVVINPNNPTGANYPPALLQRLVDIAARHGLLLMADEIYDGILYDEAVFTPLAPLAGDVPCLSFGGLSKVWRACGWRVGWAVLSGDPLASGDYHHAMDLLGALRLCANVPGQFAIEAALHGEAAGIQGAHSSPLGNEELAAFGSGGDDTFVWIQNGEPGGLYCADETDGESLRVCGQIGEGLFGFVTAGAETKPLLATACEASADLLTWTCTLRR